MLQLKPKYGSTAQQCDRGCKYPYYEAEVDHYFQFHQKKTVVLICDCGYSDFIVSIFKKHLSSHGVSANDKQVLDKFLYSKVRPFTRLWMCKKCPFRTAYEEIVLHHHKCEDIFNRKQLPYPGTFLNWLKPGMMSPTHGIIFEESEDEDDKFKPASNPFSDKYHAAIAAAMAATPQREEVPDTMEESHTPRVTEMQPQPPSPSSSEDTGTDMEVDEQEVPDSPRQEPAYEQAEPQQPDTMKADTEEESTSQVPTPRRRPPGLPSPVASPAGTPLGTPPGSPLPEEPPGEQEPPGERVPTPNPTPNPPVDPPSQTPPPKQGVTTKKSSSQRKKNKKKAAQMVLDSTKSVPTTPISAASAATKQLTVSSPGQYQSGWTLQHVTHPPGPAALTSASAQPPPTRDLPQQPKASTDTPPQVPAVRPKSVPAAENRPYFPSGDVRRKQGPLTGTRLLPKGDGTYHHVPLEMQPAGQPDASHWDFPAPPQMRAMAVTEKRYATMAEQGHQKKTKRPERPPFVPDYVTMVQAHIPRILRNMSTYAAFDQSSHLYGRPVAETGTFVVSSPVMSQVPPQTLRLTSEWYLEVGYYILLQKDGLQAGTITVTYHAKAPQYLKNASDDIWSQWNPLKYPLYAEMYDYSSGTSVMLHFVALDHPVDPGEYRLLPTPVDPSKPLIPVHLTGQTVPFGY